MNTMMNLEELSQEELAEANDLLLQYPELPVFTSIGSVDEATIRSEISRRLRNSIAIPSATVVEEEGKEEYWGHWETVTINGMTISSPKGTHAFYMKALGLKEDHHV